MRILSRLNPATKLMGAGLLAISIFAESANAEEADGDPPKRPLTVEMEVRAEYVRSDTLHNQGTFGGFKGSYFNVKLSGAINEHFSYSLRQRLNKFGELRSDVFGATDWVWLKYAPNKNWAVSGGKQIMLIGGYEYDQAPIDVFFASRYWNNIACFQFGLSGTWTSNNGCHEISAQVTNSPYTRLGDNCFAYNVFWAGHMGPFSTLWSVNLLEYEPGHYANYIALGNRLNIGAFDIQLDYMNRATSHSHFFGHDYSLICQATWQATPWMRILAKGGYENFKPLPGAPEHVDNPFYGGGLEFFPLKGSRDVRIHAMYARLSDNMGLPYNELNIGVKWHVNLYRR